MTLAERVQHDACLIICHSRPRSGIQRLFPLSVILDIFNRGSSVFIPYEVLYEEKTTTKDPGCPIEPGMTERKLPAPAGVAAPRSRILFGGEDCLSEASSAAHTTGTGAKAPAGPRPGANGFGFFCRNKRASACGDETPHEKTKTIGFKLTFPPYGPYDATL